MPTMSKAALIRKTPGEFETGFVQVDDPRQGELLVRMVAAGTCHSDDHVATGDAPMSLYPIVGGHEGAGIVEAVGPHTLGWEVGDHVIFTFVQICGTCEWCARGMSNLCDQTAHVMTGARADDPSSYRLTENGQPVGQLCGVSTFSEYTTVSVQSCIKIDKSMPLKVACLIGCGVPTGWGSATKAAGIEPGNTVIVLGAGGLGMNAIQGAVHKGATNVIAVDPVAFKREQSHVFGATHAFATAQEAGDFARSVTNGQGADAAIVTIGVTMGEHIAEAVQTTRKGGTVVMTGLGWTSFNIPVPLRDITGWQRRLQGCGYGMCNPYHDIPNLVRMYQAGRLKLDELITREYSLDEVAQAYQDQRDGLIVRGVINIG